MRNKGLLLVILLLLFSKSWSQSAGNEWINFNQEYIKIKVAEDGFYQVQGVELQQYGFPLTSVPASRVRMYRKGQEISITRNVNEDGVTLQSIEFWGEKNDGSSDTELYVKDAQPHREYNLFTDTATYFLTWTSNASSKRILTSTVNDNTGLTPESFHLNKLQVIQTSRYYGGRNINSDFRFTAYDFAEGFTGTRLSKNQFQEFTFQLDNQIQQSELIELDVVVIGENKQRHKLRVQAGPGSSNLSLIDEPEFDGQVSLYHRTSFNQDILAGVNTLTVRLTALGTPETTENLSLALVEVRYPEAFVLAPGENKIFNLQEKSGGRSYIRINSTNGSNSEFYDISDPFNPIKLLQNNLSDRIDVVVDNTEDPRTIAAVSEMKTPAKIESVNFEEIDLNSNNYLIISTPELRDLNGEDPVQQYAAFRSSSAGDSYQVEVANIDQVFDQFNYGDPSPLAIVRALREGYGSIQNVLLIGKGWTTSRRFYRDADGIGGITFNIPTFGEPGGDAPFSVGLDPANPEKPAIPVGRLNALTPQDVANYLEKVIQYESKSFDNLSNKRIIQLSGGQTSTEIRVFENYVQNFQRIAENDFLGAIVSNKGKTTSSVTEEFNISEEVNAGVGMVTLFGHSSALIFDIEIGFASDDRFGYANEGKYPVILVNGCNAGSIFSGSGRTLGEDWVFTEKKGAIAFLSNSGFASSSNLRRFTDLYYNVAFSDDELFGSTLGEIYVELSKRFFELWGTGDVSKIHVYQNILQGDPAIRPFAATRPDFEILSEEIQIESFEGGEVLASQDSFKLLVPVRNFGKTAPDSMLIQVSRTFSDGEESTQQFLVPSVKNVSTYELAVKNEVGMQIEGLNQFVIQVDFGNDFIEINENNNQATASFNIFGSKTLNLFPQNLAIIHETGVDLRFQSTDILSSSSSYQIEVDTSSSFNSGFLQANSVAGSGLITYNFDFNPLAGEDTIVFYWRTRIDNPITAEDSIWSESSFSYVQTGTSNWGIFDLQQFDLVDPSGLEVVDQSIVFEESTANIEISTMGTEVFIEENLEVIYNEQDLLLSSGTFDQGCRINTINAIAFDKESSELKRPIFFSGADEFNNRICGRLPQMIHNFTEGDVFGTTRYLDLFINNMETGDKIVLFNIDSVAYSNWDDQLKSSLELVGVNSVDVESLMDGQPLIIYGEKGMSPGEATFIDTDGSSIPVKQKLLELDQQITGRFTSASFSLPVIGPVRDWTGLEFGFNESGQDSVIVSIEVLDENGNPTLFSPSSRVASVDLTSVDASQFPFARFRVFIEDQESQTPPQLDYFTVSFEESPEGIPVLSDANEINLQEGQDIQKSFGFVNISNVDFTDSIGVSLRLTKIEDGSTLSFSDKIAPPAVSDTSTLEFTTSSLDRVGRFNAFVNFIPQESETYSFNNTATITPFITVNEDQTNPIVDVTVDGRYILDGDIVSARPLVSVRMTDENPYLQVQDTTAVILSWKSPSDDQFRKVNYSNPTLNYTPASAENDFELTYQPANLEDGIHTMRVDASDESGNQASEEPYEISFEVINESSITHFYPYPNPFSTSCRFVFTLTGSSLPEEIKVQIMTISGRIVKEIDETELGSIHIGNNISEYVWDGTDEYGDELANGVYFYRVIVKQAGERMELRNTSADQAFKNGFGKLYILR